MLAFAIVGLVANGVSITLLAARREESLNMRGAFLEVLGDTIGSGAAILAAVVVLTTGFDRADSIASLLIAVLILPRAWSLLRDCLHVLLESAPRGVDMEVVRQHLVGAEGVTDVHDLHAWSITSGMPALSAQSRSPRRHSRVAGWAASSTSSASAWPPTSASTTPPSRWSRRATRSTSQAPPIPDRTRPGSARNRPLPVDFLVTGARP